LTSVRNASAFLAASALLSFSAVAANIGNRDDRAHTVTIIEGNGSRDHIVKPKEVLEGVCRKGCLIRLDHKEEDPFELEGSEVTSIEGGLLYDDGLDLPPSASSGDGGLPSQGGSRP
jgi:hypothetical protein